MAEDIVERLRERNRKEASRRNSAYDRFGMDNTPENVDPDVWEAAAEITALRKELRCFKAVQTRILNDETLPEEIRVHIKWVALDEARAALGERTG